MDEAKSLVNMAISAIITAGFLLLAIGLIGVGYMIWGYFSRQEDSAREMKSYVNYTAFDNTLVRGQEVIQLIQSDDDIFVMVFDGKGDNKDALTIDLNSKCIVWARKGGYAASLNPSQIQNTVNNVPTFHNALQAMKNFSDAYEGNATNFSVENFNKTGDEYIQRSYEYMQAYMLNPGAFGDEYGNYAAYQSCLVYDDNSSDVVGVLFVKVPKEALS